MTAPQTALVAIAESEYEGFFTMAGPYHEELEPYVTDDVPWDADRWRTAVLNDMEGRELLWIVADGTRAGFAVIRTIADWPNEERKIASIAEFYVLPGQRRRGIGHAAVEALLAEHRRRGTALVEAAILAPNEPARAFWAGLGFEVEFLQTSRKP
ncbi:MAG TPA: GNAT family N-acetyltransferase [Dehalococcoidia bacterium]|nr:GNAT family N-acetyltransferase [Dehalococcoidia bacterium]